ncbi:MAG: hypothetical protein AB7I32_06105 [Gammaproteobacteria bacterium]
MNGTAAATLLVALAVLTAGALVRLRDADAGLQAAAFERAHALAAAAVDAARRERVLWLHTESLLLRAVRRAAVGDTPSALRLARAAHREAELARNQARLEAARYGLELGRATLAAPALTSLERALHAHDGRAALALARHFGLVD